MRSRRTVFVLVPAFALLFPAYAYAAERSMGAQAVPPWLWAIAGAVGMGVAALLLVDAILLRRVAEGSIVAENIGYMMNSVVCFAAAVIAAWVGGAIADPLVAAQAAFASHMLVVVGMALLAVYFMRVRFALTRFLRVLSGGTPSGRSSEPAEEQDA